MSINPITAQQPESKSITAVPTGTWQNRSVQHGNGLTKAESMRLYLRLFGAGAIGTGLGVMTLTWLSIITGPVTWVCMPLFLAAGGAIWYSTKFDDYENPEELEKYRNDAMQMNLEQIVHNYGWNNVLQWGILSQDLFIRKYREQVKGKDLASIIDYYEKVSEHLAQVPYPRFAYTIPSPFDWRNQWRRETKGKTFEQIMNLYSLEKLEKYGLLEAGELNCLKELKKDLEGIKQEHDQKVAVVETEFANNTKDFWIPYNAVCIQEREKYNSNAAVKGLQEFDLKYMRQRENFQNQANDRKTQARAQFDQAVSQLTNNGKETYSKLKASDKAIYDQKNRELQLAIAQADNDVLQQINSIDQQCIRERTTLNAEEVRIRAERDNAVLQAKQKYDSDVASHEAHKQTRLNPLNEAWRKSINNINDRYLSYLRIIDVAN